MKIYTLLFGALVVCPMQAQTVHDWENHHVLQINRKPARAAFIPFSTQKGDLFGMLGWNVEIQMDTCT